MGEPLVLASSLAVGSSVYCNVNGTKTEFIIVHQSKPSSLYDDSCNGTWLLMKDIYEDRQWNSSDVNNLENSTIHSYLNSTFLELFDSSIQDAIKQVKIPYRKNGGSGGTDQGGANGLPAKIFLLSCYEVGWTTNDNNQFPVDGAKLDYFESGTGTSANNKRIAKLNGMSDFWWLRAPRPGPTSTVWCVRGDGGSSYDDSFYSYGIRPAFIIPSTALIDSKGNITGKTQSLSGTWVFNSTLGNPSFLSYTPQDVSIQASSNSLDITAMRFEISTATDAMQILYMLPGSSVSAYDSTESIWTNQAYRVITFTEPFKRENNVAFYDWFINNATRGGG